MLALVSFDRALMIQHRKKFLLWLTIAETVGIIPKHGDNYYESSAVMRLGNESSIEGPIGVFTPTLALCPVTWLDGCKEDCTRVYSYMPAKGNDFGAVGVGTRSKAFRMTPIPV